MLRAMKDIPLIGWVGALWRGEVPLVRAWWLAGVLGGGLLLLTFLVFLLALTEPPDAETARVFLGWLGVVAAYFVWALVGIWRCAGSYTGPRHWRLAARGTVLAGVAVAMLFVLALLFPPGR